MQWDECWKFPSFYWQASRYSQRSFGQLPTCRSLLMSKLRLGKWSITSGFAPSCNRQQPTLWPQRKTSRPSIRILETNYVSQRRILRGGYAVCIRTHYRPKMRGYASIRWTESKSALIPIVKRTQGSRMSGQTGSTGSAPFRASPGQRGEASIVLIGLAGLMLALAQLVATSMIFRNTVKGFAYFDEERALFCRTSLFDVALHGPNLVAIPGQGLKACLPPRIDYAAPGVQRSATPQAFCAVLQWAQLPLTLAGEKPCISA